MMTALSVLIFGCFIRNFDIIIPFIRRPKVGARVSSAKGFFFVFMT